MLFSACGNSINANDNSKSLEESTLSKPHQNTDIDENSNEQKPNNEHLESCYYISVADLYNKKEGLSRAEFFNSADSLGRLKQMNEDLNNEFEFVELSFQPFELYEYYNGDKKFTASFPKHDLTNQEFVVDGKNIYITPVKAAQFGKNLLSELNERIYIGNGFNDDDYTYTLNKTIPTILGYAYQDYYSINDSLTFNYLGMDSTFQVVGFLNENTIIEFNREQFLLDEYICTLHLTHKYLNGEVKIKQTIPNGFESRHTVTRSAFKSSKLT